MIKKQKFFLPSLKCQIYYWNKTRHEINVFDASEKGLCQTR